MPKSNSSLQILLVKRRMIIDRKLKSVSKATLGTASLIASCYLESRNKSIDRICAAEGKSSCYHWYSFLFNLVVGAATRWREQPRYDLPSVATARPPPAAASDNRSDIRV